MAKQSLVQEVSKLKSLLDVAAAATTSGNNVKAGRNNNINEEDDEDMDVSFIREEIVTQKEIIISRDQVGKNNIECNTGWGGLKRLVLS